jgi:Na+/H+ antiporter NhaD/arsenite permease-like protein
MIIKAEFDKLKAFIYYASFGTTRPDKKQLQTAKLLLIAGIVVSLFIVAAYYSEKYKAGSGYYTVHMLCYSLMVIAAVAKALGRFFGKKSAPSNKPSEESTREIEETRQKVKPNFVAAITIFCITLAGGIVYSFWFGVPVKAGVIAASLFGMIALIFGTLISIVIRKPPRYATTMFLVAMLLVFVLVVLSPSK